MTRQKTSKLVWQRSDIFYRRVVMYLYANRPFKAKVGFGTFVKFANSFTAVLKGSKR